MIRWRDDLSQRRYSLRPAQSEEQAGPRVVKPWQADEVEAWEVLFQIAPKFDAAFAHALNSAEKHNAVTGKGWRLMVCPPLVPEIWGFVANFSFGEGS